MKKTATHLEHRLTVAKKRKLQEQTRRTHGTNPREFEKKILEHTNDKSCGDCWTQSHALLQEVLVAFPQCPIEFTVRNFNNLKRGIKTVTVYVPGLGWGRAYDHYVPINLVSAKLEKFLTEKAAEEGLNDGQFRKLGQRIANILQRVFVICHQDGGDPATAGFTEYEFFPKLRKKR